MGFRINRPDLACQVRSERRFDVFGLAGRVLPASVVSDNVKSCLDNQRVEPTLWGGWVEVGGNFGCRRGGKEHG